MAWFSYSIHESLVSDFRSEHCTIKIIILGLVHSTTKLIQVKIHRNVCFLIQLLNSFFEFSVFAFFNINFSIELNEIVWIDECDCDVMCCRVRPIATHGQVSPDLQDYFTGPLFHQGSCQARKMLVVSHRSKIFFSRRFLETYITGRN